MDTDKRNLDDRQYYAVDFPADAVWKFFSEKHKTRPETREYATEFSLGGGDSSAWKRYISCQCPDDLRDVVTHTAFQALHIGPSFSDASHRARAPNVNVVGKELVFDLDLQDVAWLAVGKEDQGSNDRFVRAVFASCAVLVEILKEVMGFEHFVAVYSGRRGVHLWVLDDRAFGWNDAERGALCKFIALSPSKRDPRVIDTSHIRKNPSFGEPTWAALDRALEVLLAPKSAGGVGLLDKKRDIESFIDKLFDVEVEETFVEERAHVKGLALLNTNTKTGKQAYEALKDALVGNLFYVIRLEDAILSLLWPVIDLNVTAKTNHVTKAMFSLHAKTGRVAVPLSIDSLFSTAEHPNPPIVKPSEINVPDSTSSRYFKKGLKALDDAVAALAVARSKTTTTPHHAAKRRRNF